ncbi:DUF418 domain-containing protein [Sphingobium nicotianae]|uniref:DUF418 domain-containing protein n=1 Tax=Sphingobium nicotianae TaxID=2782607 RepID=A0A9X1IRR4_9SPHN|nr:DUF418 domain-containing protein [Sphingobium nicotianae]MBT2187756.1 DUF418 domain-containing protein [Sphingobium nicotianae]
MAAEGVRLAPVRGRARIEVLDILRGIAILGILYMNIPYMGNNGTLEEWDIRLIGWSAADRTVWAFISTFWNGTQRGLLEFLFGAGAMVLTARAMTPDGPVAVADLFYRRNLWLILFGLIDIFLVTWIGDILLVYGLAALIIFPFRKLGPRLLIFLGLLFAGFVAVGGVMQYQGRVELIQKVPAIQAKEATKQKLSKEEADTLKEWRKLNDHFKKPDAETQKEIDKEAKAHHGGVWDYVSWAWYMWNFVFIGKHATFFGVCEAVCGMLLGMAWWKLGIIQGQRSARFYGVLALIAYAVGMGLRGLGVYEVFQFMPQPKTIWATNEFARLAVSLGHVALINLLVQTKAGKAVLAPLKAAGQTAFSIYVLTSVVTLWFVFAPWGLGLWGRYGWAQLALIATIIDIGFLVLANVWMRSFVSGPVEWVWRSLAYWQRQPFRRHKGEPSAPAEPGTEINAPLPA